MDIITYALCKKADRQIIDMIQSMEKLTITVVDEVPTIETAEPNRLYLVDTNHDGTYEMYILAEVEGEEEIVELGPVVDFSDYYTKEQIDGMVTPIKRLSDSEYAALTTAQKNNGTLYLVYESVIDNRSVIGYDSEGNFVYKMTPYGCTDRNAAGNYNNHTTIAPQITGPNRFGEGDYCMKVELADGTIYYFNSQFKYGSGSSTTLSNYQGNVVDAEGSNVFFQANGSSTFNIMKGENDTWVGNTYIIEAPSIARFVLGAIPTGKTAIYYKSEKYAEAGGSVDLTQAQYDALTPATDTTYFITDGDTDINFSDFETRLQDIEENYTLYYVDGSTRVPLTLKNTKNITRIDDNTVEWDILEPTSNKMYKATVTASGTGNVRRNPQIAITEVV